MRHNHHRSSHNDFLTNAKGAAIFAIFAVVVVAAMLSPALVQ